MDDYTTTSASTTSNADIGQTVLFVASIVIGTLGIAGNGLVLLVCLRRPLQGITNIVVCNQSLIDFVSSFVFLLLYTLPDYRLNLPASTFAAKLTCVVWVSRYPLWALGVSSTINLEYIVIERFFAVLHTFKHKVTFTPLKAKLCALIPWIYGLLHELPWALTHKDREPGICSSQWQSDGLRFAIGIIAPLDHYIIPLLIICFVYTRIFLKLREGGTDNELKNTARSLKMKKASQNVIRTMFVVSISYLVCWGPNEFLYLYSNIGGTVNFSGVFHYYTVVSALCNMCINPIIYLCQWKEFRTRAFRLLGLYNMVYKDMESNSLSIRIQGHSLNGVHDLQGTDNQVFETAN